MTDTLRALLTAQHTGVLSIAQEALDFDDAHRAAIERAACATWESIPEPIQAACEISFYVGQRKARGGDGQGILYEWSMDCDEAAWWREAREQRRAHDND